MNEAEKHLELTVGTVSAAPLVVAASNSRINLVVDITCEMTFTYCSRAKRILKNIKSFLRIVFLISNDHTFHVHKLFKLNRGGEEIWM